MSAQIVMLRRVSFTRKTAAAAGRQHRNHGSLPLRFSCHPGGCIVAEDMLLHPYDEHLSMAMGLRLKR